MVSCPLKIISGHLLPAPSPHLAPNDITVTSFQTGFISLQSRAVSPPICFPNSTDWFHPQLQSYFQNISSMMSFLNALQYLLSLTVKSRFLIMVYTVQWDWPATCLAPSIPCCLPLVPCALKRLEMFLLKNLSSCHFFCLKHLHRYKPLPTPPPYFLHLFSNAASL